MAFAALLVVGATGLVQVLSLSERRRSFAILSALGARANQLGAFVWSEGLLIVAIGGIIGGALGVILAQMLVRILTGMFDPPPVALAIPLAAGSRTPTATGIPLVPGSPPPHQTAPATADFAPSSYGTFHSPYR